MVNFEINENGVMRALSTLDIISDSADVQLNISRPNVMQGVDISGHQMWLEAIKTFDGQTTVIYEQIPGGTYLITDNPKGTIIKVKILFAKPGFDTIATNTVNIQIGIKLAGGLLPELNTTVKLYNTAFCDVVVMENIISFYSITGQKIGQIENNQWITDGAISTDKFASGATAPRAIADADGNDIASTYAKLHPEAHRVVAAGDSAGLECHLTTDRYQYMTEQVLAADPAITFYLPDVVGFAEIELHFRTAVPSIGGYIFPALTWQNGIEPVLQPGRYYTLHLWTLDGVTWLAGMVECYA